MTDIVGYFSSFLVTFGLGVGFVMGGLIFIAMIAYAVMLLFKKSRHSMNEEQPQSFTPVRHRLAPARNAPKRSNPGATPSLRRR